MPRKPKEPTSLQRARKAHADRLREKGYKAATIWKSPEGQAALDKLSAASPDASTSDLVNAALISAAERLESGLVPIQRLDVDAEHRLAGPEKPSEPDYRAIRADVRAKFPKTLAKLHEAEKAERSSAKPSAAKVDGATPQKPKIDTSGVTVHPSLQKGKTK